MSPDQPEASRAALRGGGPPRPPIAAARSFLPLLTALVFALLGLAALALFVLVAEPPERQARPPVSRDYSEDALNAVLARHPFQDALRELEAAGAVSNEAQVGRQTGSPGFYRAEALILERFRRAGLEVHTQEFEVTVPVTEVCEITDAAGVPLPDVTLYPFAPGGLMPTVLPTNGLRATLVQVESTDLRYLSGHTPSNVIALTYIDNAGGWSSYAGVGVQAVIVQEDALARALQANPDAPSNWRQLVSTEEVPFPRFAARGPLERYTNQEVRLQCRVTWQTRKARNLIGVLPGAAPRREALVLTAFYDSLSLVPDLAPGAEQAVSLAALLEYVEALAPYRGALRRDVVFIATAAHAQTLAGVSRLMEAVETFTQDSGSYRSFADRIGAEETAHAWARHAADALAGIEQADSAEAGRERWRQEESAFRDWFEKALGVVAGEVNLALRETTLATRLDYLRADSPVYRDGFDLRRATDAERNDPANSHPLLTAYLAARQKEDRSANLMSFPLWTLVRQPEYAEWQYGPRARAYFDRLAAWHEDEIRRLRDSERIQQLFAGYAATLTLTLELNSGGSRGSRNLALLVGCQKPGTVVEPQVSEVAQTILEKTPHAGFTPDFAVYHWGARDAEGSLARPNTVSPYATELESEVWYECGRLAFTLAPADFFPPRVCTPDDTFDNLRTEVLEAQIPVLGRSLLALAYGRVPFKPIPANRQDVAVVLQGAVYGSAGAASLVASHPMTERTVVRVYNTNLRDTLPIDSRGLRTVAVLSTDPYGWYRQKLVFGFGAWSPITAEAARSGADGSLTYFKDSSPAALAVFKSKEVPQESFSANGRSTPKPAHVAVFRCTPVALYQQNNPQTMKSFKQVSYLNRQGLTGPARVHQGRVTTFLDPDFRFYVGLLDGAVGNEQIQEYRAFLLNADPAEPVAPEEPEVYGRGYLAADTPTLPYPYLDASASLLRTGGKRLALQKAYGMADPQMLAFHERAGEWLASAGRRLAEFDPAGAALDAGSSLAYAINNHPVIRQRIAHAIWGILWYLGLLVPFVFFFEKLLFGFTDIRKQLLANGLIFLTVYLLLRLFHPAFQMVRSSLVILLGFIILLLTLLVTLMVGGKFRQNIKDLRRGEGRVEGADVSRSGVIGTAFMLGLNNMRRRKVRTGLTSLTLILITFVMICFTSVSTNLVSQEEPLGRSPWNGIMVRNEQFLPLDGAEINTIREVYGQRYPVAELRWLTATLSLASRTPYVQNTEILLDRDYQIGDVRTTKRAKVNAAVEMPWNEPAFSGIDRCLLTTNGWFPQPPRTRAEKLAAQQAGAKTVSYAILPDAVARELGITPDAVHATNLVISIRGEDYTVLGILDSVAVNRLTGLDNKPLLPYDLNSVQNFGVVGWRRVVPEDVGRLPASQVLFVNKLPAPSTGYEEVAAVSCSILFPKEPYRLRPDQPEQPGADYRTQRAVIAEFLERGGQSVYYAADGISYFGSRKRARTLAGLLELLVPILLAALTVFNTMRGSVYERKDEIYVYNAVGIAPNHVFFIFMAEALVYAVVGALLGYLLSQATGRALTALHLTGGMNMEYSSLETIYASLAIMGAVLLSTLLPARDAARLASPTDSPPVQVPRTDQDLVEFALPFTFTPHDRVAVVSYFHRWLDANGSGSSGPFFCAPPKVRLEEVPAEAAGGLVPAVTSTVWLKPYDLGVSQRLEIALPTDPETGEYVARIRIERLSGHVASWQRTLRPFLQVVRKQFLNWRVTTTADRREMFAEAKRLLRQAGRNR